MENYFLKGQEYKKAKKRIKKIKGFYAHLTVYCIVIPTLIFINLKYEPHFHWFWFSLLGWGIGLFSHWFNVFGMQKIGLSADWEENKINKIMKEVKTMSTMENDHTKEHKYLLAKKRVEKIKAFYIHFIVYVVVNIFISGIIIFGLTNNSENTFLEAISNFGVYSTWLFWGIGLAFHWLGVFGSKFFFGEDWEKKQIEKYMNNHKF